MPCSLLPKLQGQACRQAREGACVSNNVRQRAHTIIGEGGRLRADKDIWVGINIHAPKGRAGREGGRGRGPYWIGRGVECGVGPGNSWCPRRPRVPSSLRLSVRVRSVAASEAFPEAAAAALAAAAAYPKWALPFAFVAFPPRVRRLALRTTYLYTGRGRGTLPIVKGDFLLQRLALQLRTEHTNNNTQHSCYAQGEQVD